jgi:four helix bundle protein
MRRYQDLRVWSRAMVLAEAVYAVTAEKAFDRDWGLRNQLRRAAVSVVSNVVEGFERGARKEFARGVTIAKGSCGEIQAQIHLAVRVGWIQPDVAQPVLVLATEVSARLARLRAAIRRQQAVDDRS